MEYGNTDGQQMDAKQEADWFRDGSDVAKDSATWSYADAESCREALAASGRNLDQVYTLHHRVSLGGNRSVFVYETFTISSWLRGPRRAVLFLPSSVHKGSCWSIPEAGYNATAMVAERGMFAYTVDYIGVGDSFIPESGLDATLEENTEAIRQVVEHIRFFRSISQIDLVGEGYGAAVATQVASDAHRIRSCVMIALPYKELAGGPATSSEQVERLAQAPNGYLTMKPEEYELFFVGTPPKVGEYIRSTQHGSYPVALTLVVLGKLPFFDPSVARVPGLVLSGKKDYVIGPRDPQHLARDYGLDGASLATSEIAGHAPRIESPEVAHWLWTEIFNFVD